MTQIIYLPRKTKTELGNDKKLRLNKLQIYEHQKWYFNFFTTLKYFILIKDSTQVSNEKEE